MKYLSNPLDPNSLLNKEIGEITMSKTKYKYTRKEIVELTRRDIENIDSVSWNYYQKLLLAKAEPQYTNPHIEEMKRLSDEFFSKYLLNSKQGEDK